MPHMRDDEIIRELRSHDHIDVLDRKLEHLVTTLGWEGDDRQWVVRDRRGRQLFASPFRGIAEIIARGYRGEVQ